MTGERRPGQGTIAAGVVRRERSLPQPGGRPPAPGKLAVLQSFINSHFDLVVDWGADLLATREGLIKWFAARGLLDPGRAVIDDQQVRRVRALREGLRSLLRANNDHGSAALGSLNEAAAGASFELHFAADGPRLIP